MQFSAYYPREIAPNVWHPLRAYVFKPSAADAVSADAAQELGALLPSYREVERPAQTSIAEGALITATPELDGLSVQPAERAGRLLRGLAALRLQAARGRRAAGSGEQRQDHLHGRGRDRRRHPAVDLRRANRRRRPPPRRAPARPIYQSIFCSYSHKDTQIVERVERAYKALGMTFLRDVETLRSGQDWSAELLKLIERADIFQLFWSSAAAESPAVRKEWTVRAQPQAAGRRLHPPGLLAAADAAARAGTGGDSFRLTSRSWIKPEIAVYNRRYSSELRNKGSDSMPLVGWILIMAAGSVSTVLYMVMREHQETEE